MHMLETNAAERDYFERANKHGKAVWRRIVRVTTGSLPTWAEVLTGRVSVVGRKVATTEVVTVESATDEHAQAIGPTPEKVESLREFLARRRAEQEASQAALEAAGADDDDDVLNALADD